MFKLRILLTLAIICTIIAPLAADDDAKPTAKSEMKKLEGTWKMVSLIKGGEEIEAAVKLGIEFRFKGDKLEVHGDAPNFTPLKKVFVLDTTVTPKLLDIAESEKELKDGKTVYEGLYSIDGNTLKWCFNQVGDAPTRGNRPTAIESKADTMTFLLTLKKDE